ncbi:hypothetical protein V8F33_010481 [Rhypophila sp. PSN 637]
MSEYGIHLEEFVRHGWFLALAAYTGGFSCNHQFSTDSDVTSSASRYKNALLPRLIAGVCDDRVQNITLYMVIRTIQSIHSSVSLRLTESADMSGKDNGRPNGGEDGRPNGGGDDPTPTPEPVGDMGNAGGGISGTVPKEPEIYKLRLLKIRITVIAVASHDSSSCVKPLRLYPHLSRSHAIYIMKTHTPIEPSAELERLVKDATKHRVGEDELEKADQVKGADAYVLKKDLLLGRYSDVIELAVKEIGPTIHREIGGPNIKIIYHARLFELRSGSLSAMDQKCLVIPVPSPDQGRVIFHTPLKPPHPPEKYEIVGWETPDSGRVCMYLLEKRIGIKPFRGKIRFLAIQFNEQVEVENEDIGDA